MLGCEEEEGRGEVSGGGTNVDCGSLNPNGGYFPARVYLKRAWLRGVYRCGLVVICKGKCKYLMA